MVVTIVCRDTINCKDTIVFMQRGPNVNGSTHTYSRQRNSIQTCTIYVLFMEQSLTKQEIDVHVWQ